MVSATSGIVAYLDDAARIVSPIVERAQREDSTKVDGIEEESNGLTVAAEEDYSAVTEIAPKLPSVHETSHANPAVGSFAVIFSAISAVSLLSAVTAMRE